MLKELFAKITGKAKKADKNRLKIEFANPWLKGPAIMIFGALAAGVASRIAEHSNNDHVKTACGMSAVGTVFAVGAMIMHVLDNTACYIREGNVYYVYSEPLEKGNEND